MKPKVQIQVVTWNSREHLDSLFASIFNQQGIDFNVLVIDNNSSDGTPEYIRINWSQARLFANKENLGFGAAHNQGFALSEVPYVLVINPDAEIIGADFLQLCAAKLDENPKFGAIAPKIYRSYTKDSSKKNTLDCCGLRLRFWGQVENWGENQPDSGKFQKERLVFGPSGACALYRLGALRQSADKHGIFDERFFMYKEDVDLAWRLGRGGWQTLYLPGAAVSHMRSLVKGERGEHSGLFKYYSLRNQLLTYKKNLGWRDFWRIEFIIGYEFLKFVYILLKERGNLKAYRVLREKSE